MTFRWRTAADAVTAALGMNVWASLVFIPALFIGGFRSGPDVVLGVAPLVTLALGLVTRRPFWLLLAYPGALLLPLVNDPRVLLQNVYGPVTFFLVATSLVAFVLGAAFFSAFSEPAPPDRLKRLSTGVESPARWKRRARLYRALAGLSVLFPVVLLYAINFSDENQAYLKELYPGRARAMTTILNLGLFGVWLGIFFVHFVGVLKLHRTGDRGLLQKLKRLREETRRGRPRAGFYVAVAGALVFMGLLVLLRYR